MKLEEYKNQVMADVKVISSSNMSYSEEAFLELMLDMLEQSEEVSEFKNSYFIGKGRKGKNIQFDGYAYDYADKTFSFFICDYVEEKNDKNITNSQIEYLANKIQYFVECVFDGYIKQNLEESSNGYSIAMDILDYVKNNELNRFKFYVITNKPISKRVNHLKREAINEIPIELNVWDITRFYDLAKSNMAKETIIVDTNEFGYIGIPSVRAVIGKVDNYQAYLSVIPGDLLAKMYIEYGARLLEGNVRSFLSVRGKVNKAIRNTIINEPNKFFAFNNGIAATATNVEIINNEEGVFLNNIENFQIINGGQTTASIANAVLNDKNNVEDVFVPMKLSIVSSEEVEKMIPLISRSANTQNKVDEADFFSNSPFHVRFEEFSRKTFAPAINGNQYQTMWFYERARGQHTQEQMKLTQSKRNSYLQKNPKNQVIKKVDLAKYLVSSFRYPHEVSKGAQSNMKFFAKKIEDKWVKDDSIFNLQFYKNSIAWAIIFKDTEKLVSQQTWYQEIKSYRANIVTYSIAVLSNHVVKNFKDRTIDLKRIWNNQKIYQELENQLIITSKEVYNYITDESRPTLNVTEWCKKEACWTNALNINWKILDEFNNSLLSLDEMKSSEVEAKKNQRQDNKIATEIEVINCGTEYWLKIVEWGTSKKLLSPMDMKSLEKATNFDITGRIPSSFESEKILQIRNRLILEGLPINELSID